MDYSTFHFPLFAFVFFSDFRGFEAPHGGVIPPHALVTTLEREEREPDLFILDEVRRVIIIMVNYHRGNLSLWRPLEGPKLFCFFI